MRKVEINDIEKELINLSTNKNEDCIYCIHENPLVFRSKNNDVNDEYCIKNNIQICNSFNMGGTIVANTGDIDIAIFKKEGWDIGRNLLQFLCEKLRTYIPNIKVDGNDIITDEKYKVISNASINVGERYIYTCVHISFNPNIELIKNTCNKPMVKIPKGLNSYNISQNYILNIISQFLQL